MGSTSRVALRNTVLVAALEFQATPGSVDLPYSSRSSSITTENAARPSTLAKKPGQFLSGGTNLTAATVSAM